MNSFQNISSFQKDGSRLGKLPYFLNYNHSICSKLGNKMKAHKLNFPFMVNMELSNSKCLCLAVVRISKFIG